MGIEIIGTGHIFERSVREVREAIYETRPDVVAVELDEARYRALAEQGFSLERGVTSRIHAGCFGGDTKRAG